MKAAVIYELDKLNNSSSELYPAVDSSQEAKCALEYSSLRFPAFYLRANNLGIITYIFNRFGIVNFRPCCAKNRINQFVQSLLVNADVLSCVDG